MNDRIVDFKILVRAKRERVYDAMTTSAGLDGWFTSGAAVDPRPGGRIHFRWKNWGIFNYTGEFEGPVLDADRPSRFVFRWPTDSRRQETTVTIDFQKVPQGTLVHLIERGYSNDEIGMDDFLKRHAGWPHVLTLMKFYVEHGHTY